MVNGVCTLIGGLGDDTLMGASDTCLCNLDNLDGYQKGQYRSGVQLVMIENIASDRKDNLVVLWGQHIRWWFW